MPQHLITKGRLPYGETHIPYIGERLHNHTVIKTEKGGNGEEEKQDLMLCHCFAGVNKLCGNSQPFDTASNRPVSYNTGGRFQWVGRQYPTLTPYGLYPYCWAKYNELLMNSSPILRVRLNLPTSMIFSLDMSKPKLLNGRKVMVVSYTIEMSDASIKVVSANLQQIPAYKDAITDKSIGYVPEGYRLGWELVQSWPGPNSGFTYNKTPYTQADAPVYHPLFEGQVAKYRMITEDPIISRWCDINEYFKGVLIPI